MQLRTYRIRVRLTEGFKYRRVAMWARSAVDAARKAGNDGGGSVAPGPSKQRAAMLVAMRNGAPMRLMICRRGIEESAEKRLTNVAASLYQAAITSRVSACRAIARRRPCVVLSTARRASSSRLSTYLMKLRATSSPYARIAKSQRLFKIVSRYCLLRRVGAQLCRGKRAAFSCPSVYQQA